MNSDTKIALLLFLIALLLRVGLPETSPPGFNDDELSNALVINQLVREGDIRVYYPHASGHEGLYHILSAPFVSLFGKTYFGIRGLSILFGALSVALLYLLAAQIWGRLTGVIAAVGLAFSYWGLVYSRVGQRHISLPVFALLAFYCWWRGTAPGEQPPKHHTAWFAAAGMVLGLSFYTYFASRGIPLILIAFAGYLLFFHRDLFKQRWRGMVLALLIAAIMAAPLIVTLRQNPAAEARVAELAAPVYALREGDPSMLMEYTLKTLGMFAFTGDDEALYNIPGRPVFGAVGALFFFIGLAWAAWHWRKPHNTLLLLWMAAGIAPGALAVPAASLGHTILAQPVAFIFPAVGVTITARWFTTRKDESRQAAVRQVFLLAALAIVYLGVESTRNLHDYFVARPQNGFVRVLFHHDFIEMAKYLNHHPEIEDIFIGAQINERWNQVVFEMTLTRDAVRARWYDPYAASVWGPPGSYWAVPHYLFELKQSTVYQAIQAETEDFLIVQQVAPGRPANTNPVPFKIGLTHVLSIYDYKSNSFSMRWRVDEPLDLPPRPLYSKPPVPGQPAAPRLEIFVHVLPEGETKPVYATGGLGVDPYTLQPGDVFYPEITGIPPDDLEPGTYRIAAGLFDPWTGERYLIEDGRDMFLIEGIEIQR